MKTTLKVFLKRASLVEKENLRVSQIKLLKISSWDTSSNFKTEISFMRFKLSKKIV